VVIPNNTVFGSTVINYSKMPLRRVDIVVPVEYSADIETVKSILQEFVAKDERIQKDPAPFCRLTEYGASSLNFTLRVWVNAGDYWAVRFDLLEGIIGLLRQNKIEIPYDQLDVHVIKSEEVA
jgi:small conductance mechanosensitive channel